MNSPKISESLNRFFSVTNANSDFAANDVINMRGGSAVKAGTFHKWNIFRRLGRSDDEIRANNDTRQQFLNALKESFGLAETGKALVDKLATILGKDVFKPEDYTFGKDGKLNSGKPLTDRRITDVYEAVTEKVERAEKERIDSAVKGKLSSVGKLNRKMCKFIIDYMTTRLPKLENLGMNNEGYVLKIKESFDKHIRSEAVPSGFANKIGLSTLLRVAIMKAGIPEYKLPEKRDELADAIIKEFKEYSSEFAEDCEERESLLNQCFEITGENRQEYDATAMRILLAS